MIVLCNPLPRLLAHYQRSLQATLERAGGDEVVAGQVPSVEAVDDPVISKIRTAGSWVRQARRIVGGGDSVVVLWPALGHLDPVVWQSRSASTSLIIHDPDPIRRQHLSGPMLRRIGQWASRGGRLRLITHSTPATEALVASGWPAPMQLPIPIASKREVSPIRTDEVFVLGQAKESRDFELLADLGTRLRRAGFQPRIAGRGWPAVPGWDVDARFLPETELDARLGRASAVVVPYRRFFQSDIAVRALEAGTPLVAPRHPFTAELYGADWPGLVSGDDADQWLGAVGDVAAAVMGSEVEERAASYRAHVQRCWGRHVDDLCGAAA